MLELVVVFYYYLKTLEEFHHFGSECATQRGRTMNVDEKHILVTKFIRIYLYMDLILENGHIERERAQ